MSLSRLLAAPASAAVCLLLLTLFAAPAVVLADDWKPVDPAELALKASTVDKDADAEAILWEVRVDDSQVEELSLRNYIRIKVFTDRGRESQSKVDLQYPGYASVKDIAARVTKPDGTVVEQKKDEILERTIVKISGQKIKAKSFALAGVEPGAVIEYRWREVYPGASANNLRMQFQRGIPVQTVTYYFKPFMGMAYMPFHMGNAKFVKDKEGFYKMSMTNMPAFREESRMPPEDQVRSWVYLYSATESKLDTEKYWLDYGRRVFEQSKDEMKVNDEVKAVLPAILGDAATPEAKLERIYDFCRTKIKNVSHDTSGMTNEEKHKFKPNKSPAETLKRGVGNSANVDLLFAALAKAAGFDARLALSGDRGDIFFHKTLPTATFLGSSFIAVRVGDNWHYYSPAEVYTPFGMLGWREEGQDVLITDAKEPIWAITPFSAPKASLEKRTGKFHLSEDGTLEGDVRVEYTGQLAFEKKADNHDDSVAQREENLRDAVKKRLSTAELSDIKIENAADPVKPFAYAYHVRVPGYAQRTGKRLFLQPGFFVRGVSPLFASSERKNDIYFHYPWAEQDEISIELPQGYDLDNADVPQPIPASATSGICEQTIKMGISSGHVLTYSRQFYFGANGNIIFPVKAYSSIKQLFDLISQSDEHAITLKQGAGAAK